MCAMRYQLIIEDDHCAGRDAASIAQKFVSLDKVNYVLGPTCRSAVLSSAPIYEQAKIVAISPLAAAPAM
jgi:branched-chain amino acid transport system substrate-binding protein